jgi:hypothetical protein
VTPEVAERAAPDPQGTPVFIIVAPHVEKSRNPRGAGATAKFCEDPPQMGTYHPSEH